MPTISVCATYNTCSDAEVSNCLIFILFKVPSIAIVGSGGGFRAMVSLSGVYCALKDMGLLDCATYAAGLSGSTWFVVSLSKAPFERFQHLLRHAFNTLLNQMLGAFEQVVQHC